MSDKVYPGGHGQPSAPPLGLSYADRTAIQMPEKDIRKEQEKGFVSHYQNQKEGDQTVYGRPPANWAAMGGAAGGRPRGSRRGCCCCFLASFFATLVTIVVILGVAALVLYLALKPKAPKFSFAEATVNMFKLTTKPGKFNLNTNLVFSIQASNPNKKISLYYDDVSVELLYADQKIGEGSIPAFHQPHKNTTFLTLLIQGHQNPLTSSSGSALQSSLQHDASVPLQASAASKARVKIGRWKSRRYKIHVICSFQLSNPSTSPAHVSLLSNSCRLKIKIAHITISF